MCLESDEKGGAYRWGLKRIDVAVAKSSFPESKNSRKVSVDTSTSDRDTIGSVTLKYLGPYLHLFKWTSGQTTNDRVGDVSNAGLEREKGFW